MACSAASGTVPFVPCLERLTEVQTRPLSSPAAATTGATSDDAVRARFEEAALKFEGMFIQQMLKSMRQSTGPMNSGEGFLRQDPDDPLLGLADQLLADNLAGQRAFGIADMLLRQLLPTEALKPAPASAALSLQMQPQTPSAEPSP